MALSSARVLTENGYSGFSVRCPGCRHSRHFGLNQVPAHKRDWPLDEVSRWSCSKCGNTDIAVEVSSLQPVVGLFNPAARPMPVQMKGIRESP